MELDNAELAGVYMSIQYMELALIGAGIGGGINHTSELKVFTYKKAIQSPDAAEWLKEIHNEKMQFNKHNALTPIKRDLLPKGVKSTTWAMKLKSNGTHRDRLNARGSQQVDQSNYASDSVVAPVTNSITVQIVLMLYCMNPT